MDNKPFTYSDLLIPILIGGFSLVGIIVVLFIGRALNSPAEIPATPSATPFQYIYLGTEPAITTPLIEGSETVEPIVDTPFGDNPIDATPTFGLATRSSVSTPLVLATNTRSNTVLSTNTPTRAPTSTIDSTAAAANIYDDTDSRLTYDGNWASQSDVSGVYQGTLHISSVAGSNSVTFTFTGQQIHFFYQAAVTYGIVTIQYDDDTLVTPINEAQGGEWISALLEQGTHTVIITHASGGSVNIDRLVIPAPTPTPTRTPSLTPTPK